MVFSKRGSKVKHEILYKPSYSLAVLDMERGEEIVAESGAMVSMSPGISIETSTRGGGLLGGLARKFLTNESFFLNTFHADEPRRDHPRPSPPRRRFLHGHAQPDSYGPVRLLHGLFQVLVRRHPVGRRKNLLLQGGTLPDTCPGLRRPLPIQLRRDPHQGAWQRRGNT